MKGLKKTSSAKWAETGGAMIATPKYRKMGHFGAIIFCAWLLSGCQEIGFLQNLVGGSFGAKKYSYNLIEQDVEAPDVFRTSEAGMWDGHSSLGGIWVAHPETDIPERVIIRNVSNKKFVIGALFRRDTESPGPRLVLSSEAAESLGVSAGVPANLTVVALRRRSLYQSGGTMQSAPKKANNTSSYLSTTPSVSPETPIKNERFDFESPFIQIGIFGVEKNAENTANYMHQIGIVPIIKTFKRNNRSFWRVLVGPVSTEDEQMTLLQKVRNVGFEDAYAVTH